MNTSLFETFWWWLYANIFTGRVSAVITMICLICAIYVFMRWKMFVVSIFMLTTAIVVAYAGGFMMILKGAIQ